MGMAILTLSPEQLYGPIFLPTFRHANDPKAMDGPVVFTASLYHKTLDFY